MDSKYKASFLGHTESNWRRWRGTLGFAFTGLATLLCLGALFSILGYLVFNGIGAINWNFLVKEPAAVGEPGGGIAPSLLGTGILVAISMIIGVPLGVGVGIYLSEIAGDTPFARITRTAINTFIGVPSIVVGIFVYFILVKPTNTFSAVAGGLALGIIMIPIMARTTEDVLRLVPNSVREGGLALGAPKWRVTFDLVLPAARAGVITGGVLAVARVAGETAPLILTALGNEYYPSGLFRPIDEITLRILKYARGPYDVWHQQAYGAALLLVLGVAIGSLLLRITTRDRYAAT
ncbi:MAG TPA: phosphate ABC transporter permease PstA [Candidatus Sulfotelmatobacter sp.]|jgi:phosphate transport system permease protein